jgi:hypothetical protein
MGSRTGEANATAAEPIDLRRLFWVGPLTVATSALAVFPIRDRLPLHVAGIVRTAPFQWDHMAHDMAWAGGRKLPGHRAGVLALELAPGGGVAVDPPLWRPAGTARSSLPGTGCQPC